MDKTTFEELIEKRAEDIYSKTRVALENHINDFLSNYPFMNAHSSGNSLKVKLHRTVDELIRSERETIISKIQRQEMDKILNSLESVKFLFQEQMD